MALLEAAASDLPAHRGHIAEALRIVSRDYASFAAGVPEMQARLRASSGIQQMTEAYLLAYTLACRGGRPARRLVSAVPRPALPADAALSIRG